MSEALWGEKRAVSELVGYILVLSLIFLTIGFVSLAGLPVLDDARDREQVQNAERAFDVLNSNMAEVYERGAPSRTTEISADDAELETGDPVTFNITAHRADGEINSTEAEIMPIVFSGLGETEFVYQAGAVIRDQPDRTTMLQEPPFNVSDTRSVFTLVETFSNEPQIAGGGTVLVRSASSGRTVNIASSDPDEYDELSITVEDSPHEALWERYFETELGLDCTATDPLECNADIDDTGQTFVTTQTIEITLER